PLGTLRLPAFPTRRSSDLLVTAGVAAAGTACGLAIARYMYGVAAADAGTGTAIANRAAEMGDRASQVVRTTIPSLQKFLDKHGRSEEHTSELQSPDHRVCR